MALANFFDKIALSAAQMLKGYNRQDFEQLLLQEHIVVYFTNEAALSFEGEHLLRLLVNLLGRLYPNLTIANANGEALVAELQTVAKSINPVIDLDCNDQATVAVVVGDCVYDKAGCVYYIGADNWNIHFSRSIAVICGTTKNPVGCGAAACIAAANVFRTVFRKQLPHSQPDGDFVLSMLDFKFNPLNNGPQLLPLVLKDLIVVGLGAIGNAFIWTLSELEQLTGKITMIDHDPVALSNLQRYILTDQNSIFRSKPELAKEFFRGKEGLEVVPQNKKWTEWISSRGKWDLDTVTICVDNVQDRVLVQGALPKKLFNAWTQQENLGVSRHTDFIAAPCLCCLYFPTSIKKSISQEIADALNISEHERVIRTYLANHALVDQSLLTMICDRNNIPYEELIPFLGKPVQSFYAEVICGGVLMRLNPDIAGQFSTSMQVPTAFESAFAGVLLAAEVIKSEIGYINHLKTTSQFNLIRAINPYIDVNIAKVDGCICKDDDFQRSWLQKHI
jgi:hypothetical protein